MDIAHSEMVEKELDAMIRRRPHSASKGEVDPDELEPGYQESVRRYREARRREQAAQWYSYHVSQAERLERTAAALAAEHRSKAEALLQAGEPPERGRLPGA